MRINTKDNAISAIIAIAIFRGRFPSNTEDMRMPPRFITSA